MSATSQSIYFAPYNVPVTDPQTGRMSRPWFLFFQALFNRVGGSIAPTPDDILIQMQQTAGIAETEARLFEVAQSLSSAPPPVPIITEDNPQVSSLLDQLAEMQKQIDGLRQAGTQLV